MLSIKIQSIRFEKTYSGFKVQLHDAIYRLRFYSNSLIHILSLSNSHNNVASIQKNRADKSHRVIVALEVGMGIVHSLSAGKVEMFLCAACHAFTPHVNAWKR